MMDALDSQSALYDEVCMVVKRARQAAYNMANTLMLQAYWEIGRLIAEEEMKGQNRAEYGKKTVRKLSERLTFEFGAGFDDRNLNNMRAFFRAFPEWRFVRSELSWTHYRILARVHNGDHRLGYMRHALEEGWDTRTLQRNIDSQYMARLLATHEPGTPPKPAHIIKDPYIFEFLGVEIPGSLSERDLETRLIDHLQKFLMELGKGFAFVARQQHIATETADFYIDLVFYNYFLKCFVLFDLKTTRLTHEAIGQIDMYVRLYNDTKRGEDDNPTIGVILCTDKDETIVKYSVLAENEHLFASKYRAFMPEEQELKRLIDRELALPNLRNAEEE